MSTKAKEPVHAAERMWRYRKRRRNGLRCLRVMLHETEIDSLIEKRFLPPDALAHWRSQPGVLTRARQLQAGSTAWINAKRAQGMLVSENSFRERERLEYVMAHSLAHALMSEVALDCGYPASALKERLYVLPRVIGQPIQCGILIYTATAGNQGTLGGLVEVTRRFVRILRSALDVEPQQVVPG